MAAKPLKNKCKQNKVGIIILAEGKTKKAKETAMSDTQAFKVSVSTSTAEHNHHWHILIGWETECSTNQPIR